MQTVDLHAFSLLVIAEHGQVGDDAIRTGPGGKPASSRGPVRQVAGRRQEVELLDKAATIVVGDDEDARAQRSEIVRSAAAGQAHLGRA